MKNFWHFLVKKPLIIGGLVVAVGLILGYLYVAYFLAIPGFIAFSSQQTTNIYDRNGNLLYELLLEDSGKKSLAGDIPERIIQAFIAAEDKDFYEHSGIDVGSSLRALSQNLLEGRVVSGGSTITQQLARNVLGTEKKRSLTNKLLESAYAIRFEHAFNKDEIMRNYLNTIYFGNLAYGIESASRDYFGKHVEQLDLAEAALLAGLPKAPSSYNPFINYDGAKKRQEYVLGQMVEAGYISKEESEEAAKERLQFRANKHKIRAPHLVHLAISELEEKYGKEFVHSGGLQVYTTIDIHKQEQIESYVARHIDELHDKNVSNGAVLSIDLEDNSVLAYVGSRDYFDESIEGAVDMIQALRQPGSAMKPFTYLLALMNGESAATIYEDIHTQFKTAEGPYTPKNYDLKYHGPVSLREALASSFNIPAVIALDSVGVPSYIAFLRRIGISSIDAGAIHYGLSLTLGGAEVNMYELASAYSVVASGGVKKDLVFIDRIENSSGEIVYRRDNKEGVNILGLNGDKNSYLISHILSDNQARLRGFGKGNILELDRPAAVKTGTTRNFRDNWTVGYTPQLLTAVWVGNADASSMHSISGVSGAGPIWNSTMSYLHRNLPKINFHRPDGLIEKEICEQSGLLKTDLCPNVSSELFVPGTEPKDVDTIYREVSITKDGQTLWTEGCNPKQKSEKIFAVYPPSLKQWAHEQGFEQPPSIYCDGRRVELSIKSDSGNLDQFTISNPQDGDSYTLESTIPDEYELIPFRLRYMGRPEKVCWYLDNEKNNCASEIPYEIKWLPKRGVHELFARISLSSEKSVQTEKVVFEVK